MSFGFSAEGACVRQNFNPEDVTDGKPRVVKFRMSKLNQKGEKEEAEEEMELDREITKITDIDGFKEEDPEKHVLLNVLADLASETFVLLGKSKLDAKTIEEHTIKNKEWESWKEERGIEEWEPPKQKRTSLNSSFFSPVVEKRKASTDSNHISSKKQKRTKAETKTKICPLSPRKSSSNIVS